MLLLSFRQPKPKGEKKQICFFLSKPKPKGERNSKCDLFSILLVLFLAILFFCYLSFWFCFLANFSECSCNSKSLIVICLKDRAIRGQRGSGDGPPARKKLWQSFRSAQAVYRNEVEAPHNGVSRLKKVTPPSHLRKVSRIFFFRRMYWFSYIFRFWVRKLIVFLNAVPGWADYHILAF